MYSTSCSLDRERECKHHCTVGHKEELRFMESLESKLFTKMVEFELKPEG
jgi:hypothetical protein